MILKKILFRVKKKNIKSRFKNGLDLVIALQVVCGNGSQEMFNGKLLMSMPMCDIIHRYIFANYLMHIYTRNYCRPAYNSVQ